MIRPRFHRTPAPVIGSNRRALAVAIRRASLDELQIAHTVLEEAIRRPVVATSPLARAALTAASLPLYEAILDRLIDQATDPQGLGEVDSEGEVDPSLAAFEIDQASFTTYVRGRPDHEIETNFWTHQRAALINEHELARAERGEREFSLAERAAAGRRLMMYEVVNAEVERRGLLGEIESNQELRNANFDADRPLLQHTLAGEIAAMLASIRDDKWAEVLRICYRDLEVATETGEAELIWRERMFLDAVRQYIDQHKLKLTFDA